MLAPIHAAAEAHNLAGRLGLAVADRSHDLIAAITARDLSQATTRQITQAAADRAQAAEPLQAFSGSLATDNEVSWSTLGPPATVEDPPTPAAAAAAAPKPRAPKPPGPLTNSP